MQGKCRFRAVVRTIIAQIANSRYRKTWAFLKQRRDVRKRYVYLTVKQLQATELQTIWNTNASLTSQEAEELESASRELLPGDWGYYQSLAHQAHRNAWVHACVTSMIPAWNYTHLSYSDRKCEFCGTMPIYGVRYLCTVCRGQHEASHTPRDIKLILSSQTSIYVPNARRNGQPKNLDYPVAGTNRVIRYSRFRVLSSNWINMRLRVWDGYALILSMGRIAMIQALRVCIRLLLSGIITDESRIRSGVRRRGRLGS